MKNKIPVTEQRVLAIFAHPDDEVFCAGGTLARFAHLGAETMVISATAGQAGQIQNTAVAKRHTLGAVREKELLKSCSALNVKHVQCWDYPDGGLMDIPAEQVIGDIETVLREFKPHIVISFGEDGAYGHPDHVAICQRTTTAFFRCANQGSLPPTACLYYAYFPSRRTLLLSQLVEWLTTRPQRFFGTLEFVKALAIFAKESTMLNYVEDFVETQWYTPGFCIIEQGESSRDLYVILSGTVDVYRSGDDEDAEWAKIDVLTTGAFFGEIGIAYNTTRNAHVVARDSVTCLVFSPGEPSNFEARGQFSVGETTRLTPAMQFDTGEATHVIDVRKFIAQKVAAISAHQTQFSIQPDMFPEKILTKLFGHEFFVKVYPTPRLQTEL